MKLPPLKLSIPRPTAWDLAAAAVAILGVVVAVVNWRFASSSEPGAALPTSAASLFAVAQLGVCTVSLILLGSTAAKGTLLGNLAAVLGTLTGIGGALLAAALWAAA